MQCARTPQFYMSRVISIAPRDADDALGRLREELLVGRADHEPWSLRVGGWRLDLNGSGIQERATPALRLRLLRGRLRSGLGWGIPVELELSVWSDTATEIGIRPRWSRWRPLARRTHAYLRHAPEALDIVSSEVESWAGGLRAACATAA